MSFAIIETGGKQYKVAEGDVISIEKLPEADKKDGNVVFDKVLLLDDGSATKIGTPYLEGAKVEALLEEEGKRKKITVLRFRAKSRYSVKHGHRQPYTKVKISKVPH